MASETEEELRDILEGVGDNVEQLMRQIDDAMPDVADGPVRELLVRVRHRLANIAQACRGE